MAQKASERMGDPLLGLPPQPGQPVCKITINLVYSETTQGLLAGSISQPIKKLLGGSPS
jgi:hypothetical protein